ncbi:MAG: GFA family protein, partial [Alphaproteobacteria bacterium]|nr:GFA family protein [Alphaproteobacteria bacterium]
MVTGSCLCGAVRWLIDGPLTGMTHCHCSMCRKAHGAPFATYAAVDPESVTFLAGSDQTGVFESSPGAVRSFCSRCG